MPKERGLDSFQIIFFFGGGGGELGKKEEEEGMFLRGGDTLMQTVLSSESIFLKIYYEG